MNTLIPWRRSSQRDTATSTAPVTQLRSDWDRLFDRFLDDFWSIPLTATQGGLPLDVLETDDELVLQMEIPGVDPKEVEISMSGDVITISGKKLEPAGDERARYHYTERRYGAFQRSIRLPVPVEPEHVEAQSKNGLLVITLRKAEAVRPRKISVKSA